MENYLGYQVGFFLNDGNNSLSPNQFSFKISDSVYSAFPRLSLVFSDVAGLFMEYGAFTQGVPLKIRYGLTDFGDIIDVDFKVSSRDTITYLPNSIGLSGRLTVEGIHSSFYKNRESLNKAIKKVTVANAVKDLLNFEKTIFIDNTDGRIEVYANDDPYRFIRQILLPLATNGKYRPYLFFRNLANEVYFKSIDSLEKDNIVAKLFFGSEIDENSIYNALYSFFPFNEKLEETLPNFYVIGKYIKNDLTFNSEEKTVAVDIDNYIPVITDTRIHHTEYLGRQFNPDVSYSDINKASISSSLKSGVFVDKAKVDLNLNTSLISGRSVDLLINLYDENRVPLGSETFSGKWLIEQSIHTWNGEKGKGCTELILCRSSMKPPQNSLIKGLSYK